MSEKVCMSSVCKQVINSGGYVTPELNSVYCCEDCYKRRSRSGYTWYCCKKCFQQGNGRTGCNCHLVPSSSELIKKSPIKETLDKCDYIIPQELHLDDVDLTTRAIELQEVGKYPEQNANRRIAAQLNKQKGIELIKKVQRNLPAVPPCNITGLPVDIIVSKSNGRIFASLQCKNCRL